MNVEIMHLILIKLNSFSHFIILIHFIKFATKICEIS